jgi:RNA polymerase sigma-70 factor (ECF subfamily)
MRRGEEDPEIVDGIGVGEATNPLSAELVGRSTMALEAKVPQLDRRGPGASPSSLSDASILAGLQNRESWAASALFERLESTVARSLYRVLQQRGGDFEDLVQVTFERIVRTLLQRRFEAQCSLATWASAIATNVAIDSVRARVRERKVFGAEPIEAADNAASSRVCGAERLEVRAEIHRLQRVLGEMNQAQAEAVYLHDVLGHDLAEIAEISGTTVAAAQSRLVRGRKEFLRRAKRGSAGGQSS